MALTDFRFVLATCCCDQKAEKITLDDESREIVDLFEPGHQCQRWDIIDENILESAELRRFAAIFLVEAERAERDEDREDRRRNAALNAVASRSWEYGSDQIGNEALALADAIESAEAREQIRMHRKAAEMRKARDEAGS